MLSSAEFHKDFLALRVATHEIGVAGLKFTRELAKDALSALLFEPKNQDFSWKALENARVDFRLERENDHSFLIHMHTNLVLGSTCGRCLADIAIDFPLDFTIRMLEMESLGMDEATADGWNAEAIELVPSAEDEGLVGYFSGKTIDLGLILRDQIFLDTPDYPHCDMSKDALQRSGCKVLSPVREESDQRSDNPFVKKFGKTKG